MLFSSLYFYYEQLFGSYWKHVITLCTITFFFAAITVWQRLELNECTEENDGLILHRSGCSFVICMSGKQRYFEIDEKRTNCELKLPRPCTYKGETYIPGQVIQQLRNQFLICESGTKLKVVHYTKELSERDLAD